MCLKQSPGEEEMASNYLYAGDIVLNGTEVVFATEYPTLIQIFQEKVLLPVDETLKVYVTKKATIHGLEYRSGCVVVLEFDENDEPVFVIVETSLFTAL